MLVGSVHTRLYVSWKKSLVKNSLDVLQKRYMSCLPFYPLGKRSKRGKGLASESNVGNGWDL